MKQKRLYNRCTQPKVIRPGNKVLVFLPTDTSKLLMQWKGPFKVVRQVAWLGLIYYYRDYMYIPHFASIVVPLTDLLRKGQPTKVDLVKNKRRHSLILGIA